MGSIACGECWQLEREPAPLPHRATEQDAAPVSFDDMFDDGQPQPDALRVPPQFRATPVKLVEDPLVVFCGNSLPLVFDLQINPRRSGSAARGAIRGRILQRNDHR